MTAETGGEPSPPELPWDEKVVKLDEVLKQRRIPHAFGGAIALNYHREPRSTLDIDINIFLAPDQEQGVLRALTDLYNLADEEQLGRELREQGQSRTTWAGTFVDLFLSNTAFHVSMEARVKTEWFADVEISVLSIEDLLVCKVLFDRPKDWIDIQAVADTRRGELDGEYVRTWVEQFVETRDPRLTRLSEVLRAYPE